QQVALPPPVAQPSATAPPGPVAASEKPKPAAPAVAGIAVTGVRFGEHGDKTRVVLDLSAKASFTHNVDNTERLLMIELPDAKWVAPMSGIAPKTSPLSSWTVTPGGNGHILAIQLKNNMEVVSASTLSAPFRIVFDLKKLP